MKILITGNSGSGKSTTARKIEGLTGIELFGLDKIVWKEGWIYKTKEERDKEISKITENKSWLIEGVSKVALREADTIYFLDISPVRCVGNIFKRFIKNGFSTRRDLPNNCPEIVGVWKALKIAIIFNKISRPWIVDPQNRKKNSNLVTIKSYSELEEMLRTHFQ